LQQATAINNSGQIVGNGTRDAARGFLLLPPAASSYSVTGAATYGIMAANQTPSPVFGVNLNATGASILSAISNSSGEYQLQGLIPSGSYTVTPSKTGEVKGINSLDATRIQQHLVGLITLTPNQLIAADTNGNGFVNSLDATRIQQRLVGIQSSNIIGQWKFVPGSRQYDSVSSNVTGENYQAVLVGEVSGNWASASSFAADSHSKEEILPKQDNLSYSAGGFENEIAESVAERMKQSANQQSKDSKSESATGGASFNVSLPAEASAATGSTITVPVTVAAISSASNVESFDFTVFYDPAVLHPVNTAGSNTGTSSANCSVLSHSPTKGKVIVSGACAQAITNGSETSYNLMFNVIGTDGQQTALSFNHPVTGANTFQFNNGMHSVVTTNGSFTVAKATAASVSISGKVTTNAGRGIKNVLITMTDSAGNQRSVQTTAFGYYRFDNVAAGETVTITAKARRFRFNQSSIVRIANDSVSNADFVSEQ
jgi:hypothetical protein